MTKPTAFLAALLLAAPSPAWAVLPVPAALRSVPPALLACALLTLAALLLAFLGLRRSVGSEQRAHALQLQLAAEREARSHADQALARHHEVLCRLVRRQEGVREGERSRIARELDDQLGIRLRRLRAELGRLHGGGADPRLAGRLDGALANIDGAISAVRAVAGGLRPPGQQESLRQALQRLLQDQARLSGLRYRFDAGLDPAAPGVADRAARLAVFRLLQEIAAQAARHPAAELHVRLAEGAGRLSLQIEGDGAIGGAGLSDELEERLAALDASLLTAEALPGRRRMELSIPIRDLAELA